MYKAENTDTVKDLEYIQQSRSHQFWQLVQVFLVKGLAVTERLLKAKTEDLN